MVVTAPTAPPLPEELTALLRRMRLPYLRTAAPDVLATARAQRWDPAEALRVLLDEEVIGRDAATRRQRRRAAGLPRRQDLRVLAGARQLHPDPDPARPGHPGMDRPARRTSPSPARPAPARPTSSRPSRTPRSRPTCRVAWFTLESLTAAIGRAKADGSVARTVTRICRADLIVVDDIGMLPAGQDAAEAFYRIVDAAYERRSIAVTSNIHPSGFDTIMPKTLATATVDRLLHHAHLVAHPGHQPRLAEATAGKGVIPLT